MNAAVRIIPPIDNEKTTVAYPDSAPISVWTRIYHATPELIWKAWTTPKHVEKWWGPRAYGTKVLELDVRVGGAWRFEQHLPGGQTLTFYGRYLDVVPNRRLVNTFGVEGLFEDTGTESHNFENIGRGMTLYSCVSNFGEFAVREGQRATAMEAGGIETMDRLAEVLAGMK